MNRAYLSGGVGVEHNAAFGTEAVPRFSAAVYLRQPVRRRRSATPR